MIDKNTAHKVVELAAALQHENSFDDFVESSLGSLEDIFQADSSVVLNWTDFMWGGRSISKEDMFFHNYADSEDWNYPALRHQDPLYEWIRSGRCHRDLNVTRLSDLINFRDLKKTRFYTELLQVMNCRHVLTMAVHHKGEILASVSVIRTPAGVNFTRSDVLLAQLVTPVLANALSHMLLRNESEQREDVFDILSAQLDNKALIVFADDFKSLYRNEKMTRFGKRLSQYGDNISDILERSARIKRYVDLFRSANLSQQRRLPKTTKDSVAIGDNLTLNIHASCHLQKSNKAYLLLSMDLLTKGDGERSSEHKEGRRNESVDANSRRSDVQLEYGLSLREFQIFQLAIEGGSSQEIGRQLAISAWSVKNHLKNIYKKTGVNSRVALAKL